MVDIGVEESGRCRLVTSISIRRGETRWAHPATTGNFSAQAEAQPRRAPAQREAGCVLTESVCVSRRVFARAWLSPRPSLRHIASVPTPRFRFSHPSSITPPMPADHGAAPDAQPPLFFCHSLRQLGSSPSLPFRTRDLPPACPIGDTRTPAPRRRVAVVRAARARLRLPAPRTAESDGRVRGVPPGDRGAPPNARDHVAAAACAARRNVVAAAVAFPAVSSARHRSQSPIRYELAEAGRPRGATVPAMRSAPLSPPTPIARREHLRPRGARLHCDQYCPGR
ncbi:hypothetical protein OBBRIDRAFT_831025 [Obba rivulosa]|uniref:Uncharacterized protein n=1 Tax=Obba rivulosa TaxID=1052685 RepID=A0A8E2J7R3_9APHY|nr:hypothetical protein OBBRIDRAFT_831025 [Obba rivulosa]